MTVNLTTVQQDLSYLLGEQTVPSSGVDDRARFIQVALERAYRAYNFPMNKLTATVAMISGVATLPTTVMQDSVLDIREVLSGNDNDRVYKQIDYEDFDSATAADYAYYLNGYEGSYAAITSSTGSATLKIRYSSSVPILNASISTPFPSSMALARGALIYVRQAEDPQADISQEESIFQAELQEIIAQYNRSRPQRRMITRHEDADTYIGYIGGE
jgi:hypothetical protein